MYEVSYLKLSDRYYKDKPWPEMQHIAEVVDHDHVFCLLYKVRKCSSPSLDPGGIRGRQDVRNYNKPGTRLLQYLP